MFGTIQRMLNYSDDQDEEEDQKPEEEAEPEKSDKNKESAEKKPAKNHPEQVIKYSMTTNNRVGFR